MIILPETDIAKTNLYIKKLLHVLPTEMGKKKMYIDSRHSDAFAFITVGSCTYTFENGQYSITTNAGDILYLAHNAAYSMDIHTERYGSVYCDFSFDATASDRKSDVYTPQNTSDAENLFRKLLHTYTHPSATSFPECMSLLYKIYGTILLTANRTYVEPMLKNRIAQAKTYIDINFGDNALGVSFLAGKTEMSEVYFRKLFKAQYGTSPSQYIASVRLQKAKKLMQYPFLTLEECALQSGFSSLQYFCRVFKKALGVTPSDYRNQKPGA